MAVVAGGRAMLGQTWAQAHLDSTHSAIIMSMEPVFAAFFAELAAMPVVELAPRRKIEAEVTHLAV